MDSMGTPFNFLEVTALAGVGAFVLILVLTPFADQFRLIDRPDARKNHASPVPMVGGLAIYLILLSGFILVDPPLKVGWFMFALTLLVITGLLDDAFGLGVKRRRSHQAPRQRRRNAQPSETPKTDVSKAALK